MEQNKVSGTRFLVKSVVDGFLLDCSARRLSPNTLSDYRNTCRKLTNFFGDEKPIADVTRIDMRNIFAMHSCVSDTISSVAIVLLNFLDLG